MPEETLKRTNVRLSASEHTELKATALKRNENIEDLVRQAIRKWLEDEANQGAGQREHEALLEVRRDLERLQQKVRRALSPNPAAEDFLESTVQSFFEALPVPFAVTDRAGTVEYCNTAYGTEFGGNTVGSQVVFPGTREEVIETLVSTQAVITIGDQSVQWLIHRFTVADGTASLRHACLFFPAAACQTARRSEVAMPIPPIRKERLADRSHTSVLKACVEQLQTAAVLKDLEGRYLWYNPYFGTMLPGKSGASILGKCSEDLFPIKNSSVRKREERVRQEKLAIIATEVVGENIQRTAIRFPVLDTEGEVAYLGAVSVEMMRFTVQSPEPPLEVAFQQN